MNYEFNEDYKTKYEFIQSVQAHAEIVFEWKNEEYEICSLDGKKWLFWYMSYRSLFFLQDWWRGEGLRLLTDKLDCKNYYAFNPSFDK